MEDALAAMSAQDLAARLSALGLPAEECSKFEDADFTGRTALDMAGDEQWAQLFDELGVAEDFRHQIMAWLTPTSRTTAVSAAPAAAPAAPAASRTMKALFPWNEETGASPGDLYFAAGDVIEVLNDGPGEGWLTGRLASNPGGMQGIFPENYAEASTVQSTAPAFAAPGVAAVGQSAAALQASSVSTSADAPVASAAGASAEGPAEASVVGPAESAVVALVSEPPEAEANAAIETELPATDAASTDVGDKAATKAEAKRAKEEAKKAKAAEKELAKKAKAAEKEQAKLQKEGAKQQKAKAVKKDASDNDSGETAPDAAGTAAPEADATATPEPPVTGSALSEPLEQPTPSGVAAGPAPSQPAAPTAQPAVPPAQLMPPSAQPVAPPAQPMAWTPQPTLPAQPTAPAAQMMAPAAQPMASAAQMMAPAAQPMTPAAQPMVPAAQPMAPPAQPMAPPAQPLMYPAQTMAPPLQALTQPLMPPLPAQIMQPTTATPGHPTALMHNVVPLRAQPIMQSSMMHPAIQAQSAGAQRGIIEDSDSDSEASVTSEVSELSDDGWMQLPHFEHGTAAAQKRGPTRREGASAREPQANHTNDHGARRPVSRTTPAVRVRGRKSSVAESSSSEDEVRPRGNTSAVRASRRGRQVNAASIQSATPNQRGTRTQRRGDDRAITTSRRRTAGTAHAERTATMNMKGAESLEELRNLYADLWGQPPTGEFANSKAWLRRKVREKSQGGTSTQSVIRRADENMASVYTGQRSRSANSVRPSRTGGQTSAPADSASSTSRQRAPPVVAPPAMPVPMDAAAMKVLEDQLRETNLLLERERAEKKTLHQAIRQMSRGGDVQELLQQQETQILQLKRELATAADNLRQALAEQEAKIMAELSAGEGAQMEEVAAMLERRWLLRNQELSRLEEENKQLEQMNDALVPQMEKMFSEAEELSNKVAQAEMRAVRSEQELVATRQALHALQSEQTKTRSHTRESAEHASPAADQVNMDGEPAMSTNRLAPNRTAANDPAAQAIMWLTARGHEEVAGRVVAQLREMEQPSEEWVTTLAQLEQRGLLQEFLAPLYEPEPAASSPEPEALHAGDPPWLTSENEHEAVQSHFGSLGRSPAARAPLLYSSHVDGDSGLHTDFSRDWRSLQTESANFESRDEFRETGPLKSQYSERVGADNYPFFGHGTAGSADGSFRSSGVHPPERTEARLSDYSSYPVEMPAWGDIKYEPTPQGSFGANAAAAMSTSSATEPMNSEQMKSAADLLARSRQTRRRLGGTAHDVTATR